MKRTLTTGDLARATGETVRTVRFYEEQGLLRATSLSGGGHRRYDREVLEQLQLILDLRELGLALGDIKELLEARASCRTATEFRKLLRERLRSHVAQARKRIERLLRLESELNRALVSVGGDPAHWQGEPCPCAMASDTSAPRIVRVLSRSGECGRDRAPASRSRA